MTTALEHIRYSCGIAGEEVANYVDELERVVSSDSSLIDELRAQLAAAQEEIVSASKDSLRLLETVKYLRGIAERGEEREQKEDETVEQFVLGYVKKLEDQLAKAEQLWQIAQGRCDGLEEKLAKAEQRVAEACALQVATEIKFHWLDAARVAKEIRSGEWRKHMKGD